MDSETVEKWFTQYAPELHRYVFRQLGNPSESEDLVQEVFVVALRKISSYQEQGNARAYLYRIAKNVVLSARRHRDKSVSLESHLENRCVPASCCQDRQESAQECKETVLEWKAKLQVLDASERLIVDCRIQKNMPFKQIAQSLEIPLNTVISKFHRAIVKLRKVSRQR